MRDRGRSARAPEVTHDNQTLPRRSLHVELCDFPRGPVVFRCISCRAGVPRVILRVPVLGAHEAPSIFVTALIRCADGHIPCVARSANSSNRSQYTGPWLTTPII